MMPAALSHLPQLLLHVSIQAAVVAVAVVAAQMLLRGWLTPQWKYALWFLLLFRLIFIVSVPSPFSVHAVTDLLVPASLDDTLQVFVPMSSEAGANGPLTTTGNIVAGIWLAGALFLATLILAQGADLGRAVARGKMVTDPATLALLEACRKQFGMRSWLVLLESDAVKGPVLMGAVRPKLLLPSGFLSNVSRDQLRHVLLHELAHFHRGDIWAGWLMNVLLVIYWFNPILWYLRRWVLRDRECACDATVLKLMNIEERSAYGRTLLDLAGRALPRPQRSPNTAYILETSTNLKRRIDMILQFRKQKRTAALVGASIMVVLGTICLTDARVHADNAGYATPEGGYTHLIVFEPAGDFAPQNPRQLLDVFNGICKVKTGYFRTKSDNGKLVGSICTDKPEELQKQIGSEPRLRFVRNVRLTAEMFAQHSASKQESLHKPAPGTYRTPEGDYTHLITFETAGGFAPRTPRELLDVVNGICTVKTGYFRTTPQNGNLVGTICTDDPDTLQKQFAKEPRLKWVSSVTLNEQMWNEHKAKKQESLP